jgi:hypothetical protein
MLPSVTIKNMIRIPFYFGLSLFFFYKYISIRPKKEKKEKDFEEEWGQFVDIECCDWKNTLKTNHNLSNSLYHRRSLEESFDDYRKDI